jgi:Xaa-Pro aminopeptidase
MTTPLLTTLRQHLKARGIDALYVPTADPHQSEYVGEHYQTRAFLTGFTGSAGTAVVTAEHALLWTDGRYFIQAERQIKDRGFSLMRLNTPGFPSVTDWLCTHMPAGGTLAFNGRTLSRAQYDELSRALDAKGVRLLADDTVLESLWENRPALPQEAVFLHELRFSGETTASKLARLRDALGDLDGTVMSSLENIGWLFNFRGRDIAHNPVAYAYAVVTPATAVLYLDRAKYDAAFAREMTDNGVTLKPYDAVWSDAGSITGRIAVDKKRTSQALYQALSQADLVSAPEHVYALKARLNDTEEANQRETWLEDTTALVRFLIWLEQAVPAGDIDECRAADMLSAIRSRGRHYLEDSFDTISAYGDNAPMMHYRATPDSSRLLEPKGLYLVDTGGQYLGGTTDITRTVSLGEPTAEEIRDYTLVLKAHINLATAVFLHGASGHYLDVLARQPLWQEHIDYKSGTGHAVGYVSGVHEGPQRIAMMPNNVTLEPGMMITNEPGIYREGVHGIRLENVYIVKEDVTVGSDRFLKFDCLSYAPFDRRLIDVSALSEKERSWLNAYHRDVCERLLPRLNEDERVWLAAKTAQL